MDIPEETVNITFGALHPGQGKAWFDDLVIEIDGESLDATGLFDFSFEGSAPQGFYTGGDGYIVVVDDQVAKAGRQSLRMESTAAAKLDLEDTGPDPVAAAKECGEIVAQLQADRERYGRATSEKATDWAIQNARVVHQCLQLEAKATSRDESMATNAT